MQMINNVTKYITSTMESSVLVVFSVCVLIFIQALHYIYVKKSHSKKKRLPPGPKGLPIVGNLLQVGDRPHETLARLAKTHDGPLMTLKLGFHNNVVATSVEMAEEILQKQDQAFLGRPIQHAKTAVSNYHRSMAWMSGGSKWKSLRKVYNTHIFMGQKLDALQGLRHRMMDRMVRSLTEASKANKPVEIGELVFATTFNMITNTLFSFDMLDDQKSSIAEMKELITKTLQLAVKPNLADFFPFLKPFDPQGIRRDIKSAYDRLQELITELIDQRKKQRDSGLPRCDDLLDILLDQCKESDNFEDFIVEDVKLIILDLFTAGAESVSSTIEWIMTELIRHPHVMAKAKQELKDTFGSSKKIEEKDISRLNYLQAVIKETMRLHPTAPLIAHSTMVDAEIGGYTIPKDTEVTVNVWALTRDPKYWDRPTEFLPERFLNSDLDFLGKNFYFIPFGSGRRICAGLPLAVRMLGLVLASIIHRFDWKLPDGMNPQDLDMNDKFGLNLQKVIPLLAIPTEIIP